MKKKMLFATIALAVMAIACLSFAMTDGKRPKLNNTKWEHKTEMFVADAGTQTITMTFEFTTKKDVTFTFHSYLPAHPAMYRNSDGTVDVIPAREPVRATRCVRIFYSPQEVVSDVPTSESSY